ncbi:hypothetical protein [Bradyrhizobium cajani]|uniref:Uncharacterized protein n=1 Tax=Bradyrhizobium cajani TaxID=1928661 RepID=A0A844T9V3_9BRAD|nr:hypothetical protein [Bradyrhizobium cajani]MCP3370773.1 hypothetical protein [Bradyrhizobium cajani]MVT75878.1 hypothetical protein [Bradyrhizobium cajani]
MTVFTVTIDDHGGHFGEVEHQERATIARVLADVSAAVRSGKPLAGDQPIILNGERIGTFSFGPKAHSFIEAGTRRA